MTHGKRSASSSSTATAAASSSSSQPMKKVKSQPPQTAPVECEKNGLHPATIQEDEDAMLVDQDELKDATSAANATTGVAANLSRKKATPPQPSAKKQLVIKLVKGEAFVP